MRRAFRFSAIFLLLLSSWFVGLAQHALKFDSSLLTNYQDSLVRISDEVYSAEKNSIRFEKNAQMVKTLVSALKSRNSFNFGFDSLKRISILTSPDKAFRIFSWQVPVDDGSYRYYGAIQLATKDGQLKLFPLIDDTDNIKDVNQIGSNRTWYGARYYSILPVITSGRPTYYVLLGWKGHSQKSTKKVIEILSFKDNDLVFGKNVFEKAKGLTDKNRIVFEYNKLNSMTLVYDKSIGMIVFDHLAPIDPSMEGNFEYYASDLSFDAYRFVGGRLKLVENIELKNDPTAMDELYIDPKDQNIPVQKKF